MISCNVCNRSFRESIINKHQRICLKSFQKKRKKFNVAGQRADGIEGMKESQQEAKKYELKRKSNQNVSKWKIHSQQLRMAMQIAKGTTSSLNPNVISHNQMTANYREYEQIDDRVPCPHCGRKFNNEVAERHIPKCKTTFAKPTRLLRKR